MIYLFSSKYGFTLVNFKNGSPSINWLQLLVFSFCVFLLTGTAAIITYRLLSGNYDVNVFLLVGMYLSIITTSIAVFNEYKKQKESKNK